MKVRLGLIHALTALMISAASFAQVPAINIAENARIDPDFFKKYDPKGPSLKSGSVPSPLSTLSRAKELYAKASAEIKNLEMEIRKNEETIQKSGKIISLARERKNVNAERVAREALSKAQEAQRKNEETLRFYKIYQNLLHNLINKLERSTLSASPPECNCAELGRKYEGFKKAIKDFTKSVQNVNKEYQEWENELRDAQIEGLQAFVSAMAFDVQILKRSREAKFVGLRQQLDDYRNQLSSEELLKNKHILEKFNDKMAKANQHFIQAQDAVQKLNWADNIAKGLDYINTTVNSISSWCQAIKKADSQVLDLLKDPEIKNLRQDLYSSLIQYGVEYEGIIRETDKKLGPMFKRLNWIVSGFALARDVLYAGMHLSLSVDRLVQLGEVGEQSYQAMQSLIEHKKALEVKLRECQCAYDP